MCPKLGALLLAKCNVYSTGTVRKNRKGWNKDLMNLTPKDGRGKFKLCADKINHILALQWVDSKVVNVVSSYCDTGVGAVHHRVGSQRPDVPCPSCLMRYQRTMFGVDKGDQMRVHGGGFAAKAHYKKWYKKQFLAIIDCMLLNAFVAWNMAAGGRQRVTASKYPLKRHHFLMSVSQSMLDCKDDDAASAASIAAASIKKRKRVHHTMEGHIPESSNKRHACNVCKLEVGMNKELGLAGVKKEVSICRECKCTAHASIQKDSNRLIHRLPQFANMTCFDIMHSPEGLAIWPLKDECSTSSNKMGPRGLPKTSHAIVQQLRVCHGLTAKKQRSTKSTTTMGNQSGHDEDEDSDSQ
jgi:Transposase IS4